MIGILLSFSAAAFSSSKDLASKSISRKVSAGVSGFSSFAFAIPFYLAFLPFAYIFGWETLEFSLAFVAALVARSITDCGAEMCKMKSIEGGDLSLVVSFLSLAPVMLLIFAPLITGDQISSFGVIAVFVTTAGALILVFDPKVLSCKPSMKSIGFALLSSFFFALNSCFDRIAVLEGGPIFAAFSVTVFAGVLSWPFTRKRVASEIQGSEPVLYLRGFFEFGFMCLKLWALVYLPPQYVVCLGKVSIVMSVIASRYLHGETSIRRRLIAASVVALGAGMIAAEEILF